MTDEWQMLVNSMLQEPEPSTCDGDRSRTCTEVSDDSSSSLPPSQNMKTTSWWAQLLKSHTEHARAVAVNEQSDMISIVSGCTGSFAEAEVLKVSCQHVLNV